MSEGSQGVRVQAATVRARRDFVGAHHGDGGVARYVAEASPRLQNVFRSPDPRGGWVDFDLFIEATVLADGLFGRGDLELARNIGRWAATHNQGIWKAFFMKRLPPTMVMRLAAGVWHHHYDGGRLVSRPAGASGLIVSIQSFPTPHRAHCLSIAGWMRGTLELGPRTDISVTEFACRTRGAQACEYRLLWKG